MAPAPSMMTWTPASSARCARATFWRISAIWKGSRRSWIHPLRAVFPSERTMSWFRQTDRTRSNCSTNGFSHWLRSMKALVMDPPLDTMPRILFCFLNPASIFRLTQWTTTELIPCFCLHFQG